MLQGLINYTHSDNVFISREYFEIKLVYFRDVKLIMIHCQAL